MTFLSLAKNCELSGQWTANRRPDASLYMFMQCINAYKNIDLVATRPIFFYVDKKIYTSMST
jgi:hypothetical protein